MTSFDLALSKRHFNFGVLSQPRDEACIHTQLLCISPTQALLYLRAAKQSLHSSYSQHRPPSETLLVC